MTDRELLEDAAKAAHRPVAWLDHGIANLPGLFVVSPTGLPLTKWDPRDDSKQAFELACDLNMDVEISRETGSVWVSGPEGGQLLNVANSDDDEAWRAAARLAITRSAAAIWRTP
jgi:hypothetical protein